MDIRYDDFDDLMSVLKWFCRWIVVLEFFTEEVLGEKMVCLRIWKKN